MGGIFRPPPYVCMERREKEEGEEEMGSLTPHRG